MARVAQHHDFHVKRASLDTQHMEKITETINMDFPQVDNLETPFVVDKPHLLPAWQIPTGGKAMTILEPPPPAGNN